MALSILSPEAQLLLLTAGGSGNDERIRELLAGPLDWEKLGWLAGRERAAPVLWERLQSVGAGPLPDAATHLQRLAMVSEFRMLHLEHRLLDTLEVLEDAGVDAMLLKGAALAVTSYGSFVRRPMVDLDMLLRDMDEARRARELLVEAGWVAEDVEEMGEFYRGHHHLPALSDAGGTGVQLELHTALFFEGHPFQLSPAEIWSRAVPISVQGRRAFVPGVHDQLLHLCLHFAWSHMLSTGAWRAFRDLEMLVATGEVRWKDFIRAAVESRGASCCYWTFRLARTLSGVAIPGWVLEALRPPLPDVVQERVDRHFTYHLLPTEALCPSVAMTYTMWRMGVRPRWSGHGGVRPWRRTDELLLSLRQREPGTRRLAGQLRNLRGWTRYVRDVLISDRS
jgi:hypothetical protein